jgi:Mce-associated membrane protein
MSPQRWAMLFSLTVIVALSVLVGWLGFRVHQAQKAEAQRSQFLEVARQGALNLTTIDWQHSDADVRRILDGATGEFHDDFAKRSQPFIEVVKQAKASTVGTITEAGLESETADTAQALVAVSVQTSNAGEADQEPRAWRMRISVQRVGDQVKVSNVGFVP